MRTLYNFIGEALHQPSDRWERWTMFFAAAVGTLMAAVMAYAWLTAPRV